MKKNIIIFIILFNFILSFSNSDIKLNNNNTYGLSIAGGAAYVFKSVGFLQALYEKGFVPDELIGTSMGSIASYYIAAGYQPKEIYNLFKEINFEDFFELSFPINGGFVHYEKFIDLVYLTTKINNFNDFVYPVKFGIENLSYFRGEYWDSGNSLEALQASISLEVFFEPFYKNDMYYSDIGVSDLFIRNPETLFKTDKYFLLRISPKLNYDSKRNFKNIINVVYGTIDIGGYYTNALYSEDKLNYDDIFELKIKSNIDPKTFYNSIELFEEGYQEGKIFVKNNDIFKKHNIKNKFENYKSIDYKELYTSLRTENYYSPRDFYYTLKISPNINEYLAKIFLYFEYLNSRFYSGIELGYNFKYVPYIEFEQFYFPFKFNRIKMYYNFFDLSNINLRTYFLEKFKNIIYLDSGFNHIRDKNYFNLSLNYDNIYENILTEEGILVSLNNYFNDKTYDLDYKLKVVNDFDKVKIYNIFGYSKNNNFKKLYENIINENFKDKLYLRNNIRYRLFDNMNFDFSQVLFLNKIYLNFEYNIYYDDFFKFNNSYGFNIEFPLSFLGVTSFNIKTGIKYNNKEKLYILFNN
ncbi:patatin-like phospholipase [Oceanotoga teriensis]|uniref:Patatin-like phospholipase n=1 Tax=Oceanotoga teriensis TaxID=515440 RepID=A0AA45C4I5_9BACT|nr:patatin-like phospholipase family protein [Oceanotoga teriensis]PWJ86109.1 patatin-like phospholipase [Oceanotoga teriensis]